MLCIHNIFYITLIYKCLLIGTNNKDIFCSSIKAIAFEIKDRLSNLNKEPVLKFAKIALIHFSKNVSITYI